jgi:type IV pilus assembly protein PilE
MQNQKGFTLLELMITITILGILAAVALPSYRQSVLKANRTDAHISMASLATLQERFYFMNNSYTGDFADIVDGIDAGDPVISDEGLYSIALLAGDVSGWTMEATAIGAQADDSECAKLRITSLGVKTSYDSDDALTTDCW